MNHFIRKKDMSIRFERVKELSESVKVVPI